MWNVKVGSGCVAKKVNWRRFGDAGAMGIISEAMCR
jgi:hypothetical protein